MNKNKLLKIIVLIITFVLISCISTSVFAVTDLDKILGGDSGTVNDDEEPSDLTFQEPETTDPETTDPDPEQTPTTSEPEQQPANNNISTYEPNEDLPYAGPADTALMISAFIIFGVIGVYTFMKMSDYSNI